MKLKIFVLGIFLFILLNLYSVFAINMTFTSDVYPNASFQNTNAIPINLTNTQNDLFYSFVDYDRSLLGWWRFESNNGTFFIDESSYANNGSCANPACPIYNTSGKFNSSYTFNGINNIISVPNSFVITNQLTVGGWMRRSSIAQQTLFSQLSPNKFEISMQVSSPYIDCAMYNSTTFSTAETASVPISSGWHFIMCVYNGAFLTLYIDGQPYGNTPSLTGNLASGNPNFIIGGRSSVYFFNGSIDEVFFFNRSLSSSEISSLYNSTVIKYFNNFTNQNLGTHNFIGYGVNSTGIKSFTDFRTVTLTNITTPTITFNYQIPSDLSIYEHSANVSYNITPNSQSLNTSTVKLYYKTNSTLHNNCWVFVNGNGTKCGFQALSFLNNVSNTFFWVLDDDDIYPATYPFTYSILQGTIHSTSILNNNNDYIKQKVFNFSATEVFNQIEAMITRTSGSTASLRSYYCNSTYFTGDPSTSANCNNFYTLPDTTVYNHTEGNSSYNIFPLTVNVSSGRIGNVVITTTSYILFRGNTGTTWTYSYIPNIAQPDVTQISSAAGLTWTNLSGTFDLHIHQYDGNDTLNYFVQACDILNGCSNSTTRQDLLQLGNQPPSQPVILIPNNYYYSNNLTVTYSQSISPNGYNITSYNISLLNIDGSFNQTIILNNYPNLTFPINTHLYIDSYYKLNVQACDINGLCSNGLSSVFLLDNIPPIGIIINLNNTLSNLDIQNLSVFASDNFNLTNITLYLYNSTNNLINQTTLNTNQSSGVFSVIYQFLADGVYYFFFAISDLANNIFNTVVNVIMINSGVPIVTIIYPVNTTYPFTVTGMNFTLAGLTDSCWYSLDQGFTNNTFSCSQSSITGLTSVQGNNSWFVSANNTFGNLTTARVTFDMNCSNANVTMEIPTYPYLEVNKTIQVRLLTFSSGSSKINMHIEDLTTYQNFTVNFTYDGVSAYVLNLFFNNESNYAFTIYGDGVCPTVAKNLTGVFLVREPYYVHIQLFQNPPDYNAIIDNRAYITAEFDDGKIDPVVENFIHPLIFGVYYEKAFYAPYSNGEATIKLYEPDRKYAYRYINGQITFDGEYSQPNITRSYGENVYLGSTVMNGTNSSIQYVLQEKELHSYRWLANWVVIFGILVIFIGAIALFLTFPDKPQIALVFGFIFSLILIGGRVIIWIAYGW